MSGDGKSATPASADLFATTRWTVVVAAGHRASPDSQRALESLCQSYWYPLYAYVRRCGRQPAVAQDLTQEFFVRLLEKEYLQAADRTKGRFRSFLLTVFKRFLAKEHEKANAQKRGGGQTVLSFDFDDGERRLQFEPTHELTAERVYERRWALTLLDRVLDQLESDYQAKGKAELFEQLKGFLTGDVDDSYATVASAMGMTEGAVKVSVHRLRRRYRELVREEIAGTVASDGEIDDELANLLAAIRGPP